MDKKQKVDAWLNFADEDYVSAKIMFDAGRWLYVASMCQQVIYGS